MILPDSIEIRLSDAMRERIARHEISSTQEEVIKDTLRLLKHLCCGSGYRFVENYTSALLINSRWVDPLAQVSFLTDQSKGVRSSDSFLALVIDHYIYPHDVESMARLIEQAGPNVLNERGVPAYANAFERYVSGSVHSPYPWEECKKHPDLNLEIVFDALVPVDVVAMSHTKHFAPRGTLLDQQCQRQDFLERNDAGDDIEHGIGYLLDLGAILPPWWRHMKQVRESGYLEKWQQQFDALTTAIAANDRQQLNKALAEGALVRGFSLGYGPQMCCREFWGEFWDEGKAALFGMPEWVQEALAQEMTTMIMTDTPCTQVGQRQTPEILRPDAEKRIA